MKQTDWKVSKAERVGAGGGGDSNEAPACQLAAKEVVNELSMKKSRKRGKRNLVHLWELGELPVYAYW